MAGGVDYFVRGDGTAVRVTGIRENVRALRKAGVEADDMKNVMHEVGNIVVRAAQPPVRTGKLKNSIRSARQQNRAVVRVGNAAVPYAGPIHWGWASRNIKPQPFIPEAISEEWNTIYTALEAGLEEVIKRAGLD